MKGVKCSWVDMKAIRESLALCRRGDQSRLERMRCVDQSTVSGWQAACNVLEVLEEKNGISHFSSFQPSHALILGRAFKKRAGKPIDWNNSVKGEIAEWAELCEENEWTVKEFRDALLADSPLPEKEPGCTVDDLQTLIDAGKKFGSIYADPPWAYNNQATRASTSRTKEAYATMTVDQICDLPIRTLADDCCHLHLWTTNAFLFDCPRIFDAWGFTYQGVFVWCKPQMGIGNCWRVSHEFLVLAIKGEPREFRVSNLKSWQEIDRDKHSSKPEKVRLHIEKASPGPYLELFGRLTYDNWTVWGNQIPRELFNQHLKAI